MTLGALDGKKHITIHTLNDGNNNNLRFLRHNVNNIAMLKGQLRKYEYDNNGKCKTFQVKIFVVYEKIFDMREIKCSKK